MLFVRGKSSSMLSLFDMTDDEEIVLERLPKLSSYKSCIKFYGHSILPPLPSLDREEIEQIRSKMCLIENRIQDRRNKKTKVFDEAQVVLERIEDHLSSNDLLCSGERNDNPYPQDRLSSSPKSQVGEEKQYVVDSDLQVQDCESEDLCSQLGNSRPNSAFNNVLLDSAENFCFIADPGIAQFVNFGSKQYPDVETQQPNVGLVCYNDMSSSFTDSCVDSEASDAEGFSLSTVIRNTYHTFGWDLDNASTATSVARSSDLGKYMDCSAEGTVSTSSTVVYDLDSHSCETVVSGNGQTPMIEPVSGNVTSSETLIAKNSQHSSNEPHLQGIKSKSIDNAIIANRPTDLALREINFAQAHKSIIDKNSNEFSSMENKTDSKQVPLKVRTDSSKATKDRTAGRRHSRSKSYTLDHPSPVLIQSHVGCKCEACPKAQISPHSSSAEFDKLLTPPSPYATNDNDHHHEKNCDIAANDALSLTCTHLSTESVPAGDSHNDGILCISNDRNTDQIFKIMQPVKSTEIISEKYEKLKEIQKERIERLLAEQNDQWMKFQAECKEQERLLAEELQSIMLADEPESLTSDNPSKKQPQHENQKLDAGEDFDSNSDSAYVQKDSTSSTLELSDALKTVSNKELCESHRSQSSVAKTSAPASPTASRSKPNLPRSKSCDITPKRGKTETTPQNPTSSLKTEDFPKGKPHLVIFGAQQKCVPRKNVYPTSHTTRCGPLKALAPISIARSLAKMGEKRKDESRLLNVLQAIGDPSMQKKFEKVSAAVKGYLTRRLLQTEKVQELIKTIDDTANLCIKFEMEAPMRKESGMASSVEKELHHLLLKQLNSAVAAFHKIFFDLSTKERMEIIAKDREIEKQKQSSTIGTQQDFVKSGDKTPTNDPKRAKLSSATMKRLERKKLSREVPAVRGPRRDCYARACLERMSAHGQRIGTNKTAGVCYYSRGPVEKIYGLKKSDNRSLKSSTPEKRSSSTGAISRSSRPVRRSLY